MTLKNIFLRQIRLFSVAMMMATATLTASVSEAGLVMKYNGTASPHYSGGGQVKAGGSGWVNLSQGGGFSWTEIENDSGIELITRNIGGIDEWILSFCLELTETFGKGTHSGLELISLASSPKPGLGLPAEGMGVTKANQLQILWARYIEAAMTSAINSAAFQLAIWMIEYDDLQLRNFESGNPLAIKNLASNWATFARSDDAFANADRAHLMALSKTGFQDQLVEIAAPLPAPPAAVPEPSSVAVWLLVAGAFGYGMRRRRLSA